MAGPPDPAQRGKPGPTRRAESDRETRRRFAEAIARAEFGRFYLGEKAARALREASARKPKPR